MGEADEISRKPDIEDRRSAFRLQAEVLWTWREPPLLAMCGRLPVGKGFFDIDASWSVLPCVRPVYAALFHGRWP